MSAVRPVSGFVAYASEPPSIGEVITEAVAEINRGGVTVRKTWNECSVGGKLIIDEICKEIDARKLFCVDLTTLNPNVVFELGCAIARNKRLWPVLDKRR